MRYATAVLAIALAVPAAAQDAPQVDYPGFATLVGELAPVREARLLDWKSFHAGSRAEDAILLDSRSAADFARGHLAGAVNLPFSEFTEAKLRAVIGDDPGRPIYIYCNNNFADDVPPVALKRAPLALNIPTFVNLHGYGYVNVWELGDRIAMADLDWAAGPS